METPLLSGSSDGDAAAPTKIKMFWEESAKMWRLAAPVGFTSLFQYLNLSAVTVFVGHLGNLQLSAVSLSYHIIYTISYAIQQGIANAAGTLCGQAYGAGQVESLGIYMQKSRIILFITSIILMPVFIFASPILKLFGQEDDIAELAGQYCIRIIPAMLSLGINLPTQKFLEAQSKVIVPAWIAFIGLVTQIGLLYLFIFIFGWGITGAAIAFDIASWGITIAQVGYVVVWCKLEGWCGFSWFASKDAWDFTKFSIASSAMSCLEQWYVVGLNVLAGQLGDAVTAVGSLSICLNIQYWETMFLFGINTAISVRVSNELGMGRAREAKYSVFVASLHSLMSGTLFMILIFVSKDYLVTIFTNSQEMQGAVTRLAYLLGLSMLLNSASQLLSGVAIGGGWQVMVAYVNLASYYLLGLPLAVLLGFRAKLGVMGILGGQIFGITFQVLILLFMTFKANWDRENTKWESREKVELFSIERMHFLVFLGESGSPFTLSVLPYL
ncbi:hypothetical protein UlMin_006814 [Ulmus minor]